MRAVDDGYFGWIVTPLQFKIMNQIGVCVCCPHFKCQMGTWFEIPLKLPGQHWFELARRIISQEYNL